MSDIRKSHSQTPLFFMQPFLLTGHRLQAVPTSSLALSLSFSLTHTHKVLYESIYSCLSDMTWKCVHNFFIEGRRRLKSSLLKVTFEREIEMIQLYTDYWGLEIQEKFTCNRKKSFLKLVALQKTAVACFLFLKTAKNSSCGNFVSIPILLQ